MLVLYVTPLGYLMFKVNDGEKYTLLNADDIYNTMFYDVSTAKESVKLLSFQPFQDTADADTYYQGKKVSSALQKFLTKRIKKQLKESRSDFVSLAVADKAMEADIRQHLSSAANNKITVLNDEKTAVIFRGIRRYLHELLVGKKAVKYHITADVLNLPIDRTTDIAVNKNSKKIEKSAKNKEKKRKRDDDEHEPVNESLVSSPPKKKQNNNDGTDKNGSEQSMSGKKANEKGSTPLTPRDDHNRIMTDTVTDYDISEAIDVSELGSDAADVESPSKSSCNVFGFAVTNELMRSVLMHPVSLPLLFFFCNALNVLTDDQRKSVQNRLAYVQDALTTFATKSGDDDATFLLRENVFGATVLDWQNGETDLTEKLFLNVKHLNIVKLPLMMSREISIVGGDNEKGFVDYMFSKRKHATGKSSVVALFEFGVNNKKWWAKQDQVLKYVRILRAKADQNYEINRPMLLVVITIKKDSRETNRTSENSKIVYDAIKEKKKKKEELNNEDIRKLNFNLKRMRENLNIHFKVKFGVFLCTPKGNNDFRVALLWRHTAKDLKDASAQFGRVLNGVQLCSYLREYCTNHKDKIQYKYLGPNCCKIGNRLFRSYDNRLRPTDRRPGLYLEPNVSINSVTGPIAETALEIRDKNSSLDFGKLQSMNDVKAMNWLWKYQGKLLIISTPYHEGVHYAKQPFHFKPIIKHLKQLHKQGFVHGDIRAYNMVLSYDAQSAESDQVDFGHSNDSGNACNGWLIDFDYGGKHGEVVYPKGYKDELHDGRRPGKEGNKITIMDDWQSLIGLIFHTHRFEFKQGAEVTDRQRLSILEKKEELDIYRVSNDESLLSNSKLPAKLLRQYIRKVSKFCIVKLDPNYQSDLTKCGLWLEVEASNPSHAATGSPPKVT